MAIVTLTTDYGLTDHYVAALKGQIYAQNPAIHVVDINHSIPAFDILKAAFALSNTAPNFPRGTVHFVSLNVKDGNNRFLLVERDGNYFCCPDNGIISLIFPDEKFKAYVLNGLEEDFSYAQINQILGQTLQHLSQGGNLESIAKETTSYLVLRHMHPVQSADQIIGSVFYIDSFQNVVINVTKELFEATIKERPFTLEFRNYKIHKISDHYSDVVEGEFLCLFNEAGYLEIAINKGNAAGLLGLEYGNSVIIEARNMPISSNIGINDH